MNNILKKILVALYNYNKSRIFRQKIQRIAAHLAIRTQRADRKAIKAHKKRWSVLKKPVSSLWYLVFSKLTQKDTVDFIPEDVYYTVVEPTMNNKQLSKAFADKNFYHQYIDTRLLPEIILRNVDGVFYDNDFNPIFIHENIDKLLGKEKEVIIKPAIDTGGGKGVDLFARDQYGKFTNKNEVILTVDYLKNAYQSNFIIQKKINQHPFFKQYNPSSVNTIRIFTYRSVKDEQIHVLHALLRIGKPNSVTDNQASGGVSVHINDDGSLNSFAVNKMGDKFYTYGGIKFESADSVPNFADLNNLAKQIGRKENYSRLLGFDFIVDHEGNNKIIEVNNLNNEINFYQMNHGPLFGKFTDEVITYCIKTKKTFLIDFQYE